MNIVTDINEWRLIRKNYLANKTIGFVPTMGHLHQGHLSLCEHSKKENDLTVVSIFVNPTQFNSINDYQSYPRTMEQDILILQQAQIDYLFCPDKNSFYPDHYSVQVIENEISQFLEGIHRPGHFTGVMTVVLKFLNLMQATRAYFGEKDYQQFLLVKKMVDALFLSTEIVALNTVRAEDGLALSSRNSRLNPEQRKMAATFPRLLQSNQSDEAIAAELASLGFKVDYITSKWNRRLGAVWIDEVRLIDNVVNGKRG